MAIPRAIKAHGVTKLEGGAKGKQSRNNGVSSPVKGTCLGGAARRRNRGQQRLGV
jgi:hypothetical protein